MLLSLHRDSAGKLIALLATCFQAGILLELFHIEDEGDCSNTNVQIFEMRRPC
jgi:hypothetical protein